MASVNVPFDKRLRRIVRKNNALVNRGVVHKMNKDGLVVAKPRVYTPRFPLKGLVLLIGACLVFKGFVYYDMGAADYDGRIAGLAQGSVFEQAGAWMMQADPLTTAIADTFKTVFG